KHSGRWTSSTRGPGPAAVHHRSTLRGPARRGLQRRLVGRGASGHGRGPPHPGDALLACWGPDPVEFSGRFFTIPTSDVRPKPVQPRPRLLSGMRSPAGLRRTAEKFDIWNPASGTLEQHLEMLTTIADMRPAGLPPVELYRRLFTTPPVQVANLRVARVDELCAAVAMSRDAGVA